MDNLKHNGPQNHILFIFYSYHSKHEIELCEPFALH